MIVTFVSQCEKKSLKRTRRILDSFANRIGDNVWQTAITEDGLQTVKQLLRKSATKSTAVSCHRNKTRQLTELVWIIGNKRQFNEIGIVPVNFTEKDISVYQDDYQWRTLILMRYATAIAGLFHDFGKANVLFQKKIKPNLKTDSFEPFRHEWVSLRLFEAFMFGQTTDQDWLDKLIDGDVSDDTFLYKDGIHKPENFTNPITTLPPFARLVAWLIVSHHKLPSYPKWKNELGHEPDFSNIDQWLNEFKPLWNSPNCQDYDQKQRFDDNWSLTEHGLPFNSQQWTSYACLLAAQAKQELLPLLNDNTDYLQDDLFTAHLSRLALMLADHHVSSFSINETRELLGRHGWRSSRYPVYANTHKTDEDIIVYKQQLDEHLIGVAHHAERIIKALPKFKSELRGLSKNSFLEDKVKTTLSYDITGVDKEQKIEALLKKFKWQDAAKKIADDISEKTLQHGFFGINMASTGSGKTLANAKIMYALGKASGQIRFNVALGLRTLTLQTGKEFQESLDLSDDELSIAVGGIAVKALFENQHNSKDKDEDDSENEVLGSASADDYLNPDLYLLYNSDVKKTPHSLSKWTARRGKERVEKLLQPPVLVCTIDHLIPATEGVRGGQQIGPMLRLLSSDLILDEPDDFGLTDLPALCRLIHWSAMLGSKVMLSTATMPPALVYECFNAYQSGWRAFVKANLDSRDESIQCAWFDEMTTPIQSLEDNINNFKETHNKFVKKRIKKLEDLLPKRKGKVVIVEEKPSQSVFENVAQTIYNSITELHRDHRLSKEDKTLSIGLVRMANIDPMIGVAKQLLSMDAPSDTCIHYCVYHSRYALAVRSHLEEKLDNILSRKDSERIWHPDDGLGNIINNHPAKHHIFVVIASPVAEVGRDHDYDWAVIEPSSMRSIIQIAGRVLRHRDLYPKTPNIHVLNKNIKALKNKDICFEKPGFESNNAKFTLQDGNTYHIKLASHQLNTSANKLTDKTLNSVLREGEIDIISAIPRISLSPFEAVSLAKNDKTALQYRHLTALEHMALFEKLKLGQSPANVWWTKQPHWCAEVQRQQRFRDSKNDISYRLCFDDINEEMTFKWMNTEVKPAVLGEAKDIFNIDDYQASGKNSQFWFDLNPLNIYQHLTQSFDMSLEEISKNFGEFRLTKYSDEQDTFLYHHNLGIFKNTKEKNYDK